MRTDKFPAIYQKELEAKEKEIVSEELAKLYERKKEIKKEGIKQPREWACTIVGALIGLFLGLIYCLFTLNGKTAWGSLIPWAMMTIAGAGIGLRYELYITKRYKADAAIIEKRIAEEDKRYRDFCITVSRKQSKEYEKYLAAFEKNSEMYDSQFLGSRVAEEAIDWISNGFARAIEEKGQKNKVTFEYKVLNNKIICALGEYDLKAKGCEPMRKPLEQVSLARVIADGVKTRLARQDAGLAVNITFTYDEEGVVNHLGTVPK